MREYWNCSEFANKLRIFLGGKPKPPGATTEGWDAWEAEARTYKVAYWVVEVGLDKLQELLYWPSERLNDIRIYCRNRWSDKLHYLRTGLKPGEYHELDTRMMHALFEGLVDFIEQEKAWMQVVFDDEERAKYPSLNRPWWRRWSSVRCPEAGIAYLEWEISLGDESPRQAEAAYTQLVLYRWWKNRPNRPDPWKESGMDVIYSMLEKKYGRGWLFRESSKATEAEKAIYNQARKKEEELEAFYEQEDQDMLIKLIMIRRSLWT